MLAESTIVTILSANAMVFGILRYNVLPHIASCLERSRLWSAVGSWWLAVTAINGQISLKHWIKAHGVVNVIN